MRKLILLALAVLALGQESTFAQSRNTEFLGQTSLTSIFSDSDVIDVRGACPSPTNHKVTAVQIRAVNSPIEIDSVYLQFGNGQFQRLEVREVFYPNTTSRIIDVSGGARCVDKIYVNGRSLGYNQGTLQVFGIRDFGGPVPVPPGSGRGNARYLGATYLDHARDADVIYLGCPNNNNRVRAVQIVVTENNARIDQLQLTFGDGTMQSVSMRDTFSAGSSSRVISLRGGERCIQSIIVNGRSLSTGSYRQAKITVIGLD